MKRLAAVFLLTTLAATAQMHKVQRADAVTRAVGVFEWTGDLQKPTASRLIPITLFIYGHFEDAGIYLGQPVPMALYSGTRYQLQTAGVPKKGFLDISYARNLRAAGAPGVTNYDEGWFGYGQYLVPRPPKAAAVATNQQDKTAGNDGRPHFGSRPSKDDDKDKPTPIKDDSRDANTPDPERPTLQREDVSAGKEKAPKDVSGVSSVPANPQDDPDRPSLRRRDTSKPPQESAEGVTDNRKPILDDPDRPQIKRGRPENSMTAKELPVLRGLPPTGLHQSIAVSDAADRPVHDFTHPFATPEDRATVLAEMEKLARALLANPALGAQMANPTATPDNSLLKLATQSGETASPAVPSKPAPKSAATTSRTTSRAGRGKASAKPVEAPPVPLDDEELAAFDLTYNSTPDYVFTAHTPGTGAQVRYVTVVAQPDTFGVMQPVFRLITDETHLNRVPRMRLIDAVDADASNRASLLFELRAQSSRQFALYRVYAGRATQVFLTGSTQ